MNSPTVPDSYSRTPTHCSQRREYPLSSLPSKLAKALGPNYPGDPAAAPKPSRHGPASDVALSYMFQQVRALKMHDPGVRVDAPDAVHQLRVAARRLRSALATFRKLTDTTSAKVLRAELQWLAGAVGQARDTEVIRARLKDMINAEPPELLIGPVAQEIEEHLGTVQQQGRAAGLAALDSDRYFRLLDSLDAFLAAPPLSASAQKEALRTVGRLVSAEQKRLKKAVRAVDSATGRGPQDVALHEVRKSAKRLRYAAEAASPIFGKQATVLARAAEGIQEILGDFQDSVVTRKHCSHSRNSPPPAGAPDSATGACMGWSSCAAIRPARGSTMCGKRPGRNP